jgi:hypothetical protein
MQREVNMLFWWVSVASAKRILLAFLFASTLTVGCNRESGRSIRTEQASIKVYTGAELDKLIVPGMSAADVTNHFGSPGSATEIGLGVVMWTYSFPLEPKKLRLQLAGFSIYLKDGKVERWSPMMEESRQTFQTGGSQGAFGEQSFQIFLAIDGLTNVANTVDSVGGADARSLKATPDLEFKANVFIGSSSKERPGEQTVILVLGERDALKLKDLSEDNFGKRLLIVCQKQAIAAPVISAPLASRQLMFTVKNATVLNSIRGR